MVGLSNRSKFATCDVDDYPLGTHIWKLREDNSNMTLNLNGCYDEWHFNCHDGSCIDITARWVQNESIRGLVELKGCSGHICATTWLRVGCYTSYGSYGCPLSYGVWWTYMLQEAAE